MRRSTARVAGLGLTTAALLSALNPALAQDVVFWDGSTGDWDTDTRWFPFGVEPNATNIASIDFGNVSITQPGEEAAGVAIGFSGTAMLDFLGGTLDTIGGVIAVQPGSVGTVNVGGAGSAWTSTGNVFVGGSDVAAGGTGTLNINTGGAVQASELKAWANGAVNLNGGTLVIDMLTLDAPNPISFDFSAGTLEIRQQDIVIGPAAPFTSLPAGKTLTVGQKTTVPSGEVFNLTGGTFSTGSFELISGGTFNFTSGTFGLTSEDLTIGAAGQFGSNLVISSGQTYEVTNTTVSDATGVLTLQGGELRTGSFDNSAGGVLLHQAGTLTVVGGSFAPNSGGGYVINASFGNTATVVLQAGASANLTAGLTVDNSLSNSNLRVESGSTLSSQSGTVAVGSINPIFFNSASATVTGAGSRWDVTDDLTVNDGSMGLLDIDAGGTVTVGDAASDGTAGWLTVSDANNTDGTGVGGNLTVRGRVSNRGSVVLGDDANEFGYASVGGGVFGLLYTGGDLYVGRQGTGTLDITSGGAVEIGDSAILAPLSSLELSDTDNTDGTGTGGRLWVQNGSTLTMNGRGDIGRLADTYGYATVTGAGSDWMIGSDLLIGNAGTGHLMVEDGGEVSNVNSIIALNDESTGSATVTGFNSSWTSTGNLVVGGLGTGELNITDNASVQSNTGLLGNFTDGSGTATVNNAEWSITNDLTVGRQDATSGILNVENGATVSSSAGFIGNDTGSIGVVTVTGLGSNWTLSADLTVGLSGSGTLNILDGGFVGSDNGVIAQNAGSIGAVTISGVEDDLGSQSSWQLNSSLDVHAGGTLTVADGGVVVSGSGLIQGTATVSGVDAVNGFHADWEIAESLQIQNNGSLTISAGGSLSAGDAGSTGRSGWLTVSDFNNTDGTGAGGVLSVTGGATLTHHGNAALGYNAGEFGYATIDGSGSSWAITGDLYLGGNDTAAGGTGTLNINTGGTVDASQLKVWAGGTINLDDGQLNVQSFDNSEAGTFNHTGGTLTVDGGSFVPGGGGGYDIEGADKPHVVLSNDATANFSATLRVGDADSGELTVQSGADVVSQAGAVGSGFGASTATINGAGSTWGVTGLLAVADSGRQGMLRIEDGAQVMSGSGSISPGSIGSDGAVTVNGANSRWDVTGSLDVGVEGRGILSIQAMGSVTSSQATIGANQDAMGNVDVTGAGSTWTNSGDLDIGTVASFPGEVTGGLFIDSGGQVEVGGTLSVHETGSVLLINGSTLNAATIAHTDGGAFNFTGGTLIVDTFTGTLDQQGGTLAPGSSPGTTTITGDYNLTAGTFAIEIGGITPGTQHDRVEVDGFADLLGDLDVTLINGFTPSEGDSFAFLFAGGGYNAFFGTLNLPDLSALNLDWQLNPGGSTLFLNVVSTALPADLSGDGDVDDEDLGLFFSAFTGPDNGPSSNPAADLSGDGDVDDEDLGLAFSQFTGPLAPVNIPEPASLVLVAVGGMLAFVRRRV